MASIRRIFDKQRQAESLTYKLQTTNYKLNYCKKPAFMAGVMSGLHAFIELIKQVAEFVTVATMATGGLGGQAASKPVCGFRAGTLVVSRTGK